MSRSSLRLPAIVAALLAALLPRAAQARMVRLWGIENIAREADAIVVGEVLRVSVTGTIAQDQPPWRLPLLQKVASVRVLRAFSAPGTARPREGATIVLAYLALDERKSEGHFDGPIFPTLAAGDVFALPLRGAVLAHSERWELLDQEDVGLLVPCVGRPLGARPPGTALAFLESELAGTFALGGYADIYKAARYLAYPLDAQVLGTVYDLIARRVGDDQARWLDIAVASYCASGTPPPPLAQLLAAGPNAIPERMALAAKALSHVTGPDLEARFLKVVVQHASLDLWRAGNALLLNYSPAALQLVKEALHDDAPGSLYLAHLLIADKAPSLAPEMVATARRVLLRRGKGPNPDLGIACWVIHHYGGEETFALVLDEITKAQHRDPARYATLLRSSFEYAKDDQRSLRVCAIMLQDRRVVSGDARERARGVRYCDKAAYDLQNVAAVDFGFRSDDSLAKRDQAIEKAKSWLAKNLSGQ